MADVVGRLRVRAAARLCLRRPSNIDKADAELDAQAATEIESQRATIEMVEREAADKARIYDEQVTRAEKQWQFWEERAVAAEARVTALEAEKAGLVEALQFYACDAEACDCEQGQEQSNRVLCGHRARQALAASPTASVEAVCKAVEDALLFGSAITVPEAAKIATAAVRASLTPAPQDDQT